jgi:hypothetical protein
LTSPFSLLLLLGYILFISCARVVQAAASFIAASTTFLQQHRFFFFLLYSNEIEGASHRPLERTWMLSNS